MSLKAMSVMSPTTATTFFIKKHRQRLEFALAFNAHWMHVFNCLDFFLKKMSLTEAQCDISITIDSLTFFILKVLFMHSHNKGNCFCSSPFVHPFYGCLCKQKSEIPFRSALEWKVLYCYHQASLRTAACHLQNTVHLFP